MTTPSGTYNHTLYHAMPDVLEALKIAQAIAKDVGTDLDIAIINYAIKQINTREIMWSDACVAGMAETAEFCAKHGSD